MANLIDLIGNNSSPFSTFQNVETPKVEPVKLNLPLSDFPIPLEWASSISSNGTPIVKDNTTESWMIVNNSPQVSETNQSVELSEKSQEQPLEKAQPNNTRLMSKNEWVNALSNAYRKLGVSENGIRNLIAKNALESGWGKSAQGKFNYGNITTGKNWKGASVNGRDHDAHGNPIRHRFRSYNSIEEFAADEVNFLKSLYDFNDSDDINTFINKLQGGNKGKRRYAESLTYGKKVRSVYDKL